MNPKKIICSVVIILWLGVTGLQAQEAILASGGNASGAGGSVSFSIGLVAYTTDTGATGTGAKGVQQPFEIFVGLEEVKGISLNCSAYPNPTSGVLTLKVDELNYSTLSFALYDMNGNLMESKSLDGTETSIIMNNFLPATYFLKVTDKNKEVKTFKIIKN